MPQVSTQSTNLSSASWIWWWSFCWWLSFVSSANLQIIIRLSVQPSISLIKTMNASGPRTNPWGTPDVTSHQSELLPFRTTRCFLPVSQLWIHLKTFPLTPWASNFLISLCFGTLSKALAKSRYIISKGLLLSNTVIFSRNSRRFVVTDLLLRNSCWVFFIRWLSRRWFINWSLIIDSKILQGIEVRELARVRTQKV